MKNAESVFLVPYLLFASDIPLLEDLDCAAWGEKQNNSDDKGNTDIWQTCANTCLDIRTPCGVV